MNSTPTPRLNQTSLPPRENLVAVQISTLLNVAHCLMPYILEPQRPEIGDFTRERKALDGGVAASVTTTFMAVCDRITAIVKDPATWSLENHATLEKILGKMYEENIQLIRMHKGLTANLAAPHNSFKPTFGKLPDGRFFAFYGDPNTPDECVIGMGDTMEAALQNFNQQFKMTGDQVNKLETPAQPNKKKKK